MRRGPLDFIHDCSEQQHINQNSKKKKKKKTSIQIHHLQSSNKRRVHRSEEKGEYQRERVKWRVWKRERHRDWVWERVSGVEIEYGWAEPYTRRTLITLDLFLKISHNNRESGAPLYFWIMTLSILLLFLLLLLCLVIIIIAICN